MIPMQFSRVMLALPIVLGILLAAQVAGGELAPLPSLRDSYASTGLLVAVALVALELPRLFEFLAARRDVGPASSRAHLVLARLALHGKVPFYPRLHVLDASAPAAVSIGVPGDGVIFITRALVDRLDDKALEVTLVHELHHLRYRHTLFHCAFVLSVILGKMVLGLSPWFGPFLLLVYLAVLRQFEFAADAGAAETLGHDRVAECLQGIQTAVGERDLGWARELVSTHPDFRKRIARIRQSAAT